MLRIGIELLREMFNKKELSDIAWIGKTNQIADSHEI